MPFKPGQSGNPSGRPKGAAGLARYIAEQTEDGHELVDRLLALSRSESAPVREATAATFALLDRMAGKPMQPSEIVMAFESPPMAYPTDWDSMLPDERRAYLLRYRQRQLPSGDA